MTEPRLLVFDLDGTLLDRQHSLAPDLVSLLCSLHELGIETTLATGRVFAAAAPFIETLNIRIPVILYNGALLATPEGSPLSVQRLGRQAALDALKFAREFAVHPQAYLHPTESFYYASTLTEPLEAFSNKDGIPAKEVGDLATYLGDAYIDPMKLLIIGAREELLRLRQRFQDEHPEPTCVLSERNYLEILAPGVSKGAALRELCGTLGIPLERVIAFGDNLNDLEMIRIAGTGVAMATSPACMQREADIVLEHLIPFLNELLAGMEQKEVRT